MKILIFIFLLGASMGAKAQTHTLEWETDTIVAIPESVLPDTKKKVSMFP